MRKNIIPALFAAAFAFSTASCSSDYLDNVPKGQKIPTDVADFSALIADEYTNQREPVTQALILMNDRFVSPYYQNYYPLYRANYNWDTSIDRIKENKSDEATYYVCYGAISTANLILENASSAKNGTATEKAVLEAQARILRAENYFTLVNYYSKTYDASTASTDGGVPLITSAAVGAAYTQPSVQAVYDFILDDLAAALHDLPQTAQNILYADKATGNALAARVYLQMGDYAHALQYADAALALKSTLFDWNSFYQANAAVISNPASYQKIASPMGFDYVENYNFRHGESSSSPRDNQVTVERAARFEPGDASFLSRWKLRTVGADTYYDALFNGFINKGGLTTTEMYLIKAECLARTGNLSGALTALNAVRKARILAAQYAPYTSTSAVDIVKKIRQVKANALIQTIVPFCDARRLNLDPTYAESITKTVGTTTLTLAPDSYLWTMPFPQGATSNPGSGTLTQNVEK